jgi:hypothetical protein
MSTKKRKPLASAIEEFVFATKEALPAPTATELASLAPPPTLEDGLKEEAYTNFLKPCYR